MGNTKNKMEGPMSKKIKKKRDESQREHQVLEPPLVKRSISNKERGGPFEKTPNLQEPSPTTTTHFQIEITCACCDIIDTLCL